MNITPEQFFRDLLAKTAEKFYLSPIHKKQIQLNRSWNYAICATPIKPNTGVIFGINWGGDGINAQTSMPTGEGIIRYPFLVQSRKYLESLWGLNIENIDFNYTNLCFFRSPNEIFLTKEDYILSIPLFEEFISFINPPWMLSIGTTNMKVLNTLGHLKNINYYFDPEHKYYGCSAQLWGRNIFSVPHPNCKIKKLCRDYIWMKVSDEMKRIKING